MAHYHEKLKAKVKVSTMAKSSLRTFLARVEYWPVENNLGYYNLRPTVEIKDNIAEQVDRNEFPTHGTINIKDAARRPSAFIQNNHYYVWSIADAEILNLEQNSNGFCIEWEDYHRKIQTVDSYGLAEVLFLPSFSSYNVKDFASWGESPQKIELMPFSRQIYLCDRNYIMGPLTWSEQDGKYLFIPAGRGGDPFQLDGYLIDDVDIQVFVERNGYNNVADRRFIILSTLPDKARFTVDCISDARLKEYVGGLLSDHSGLQTKQDRRSLQDALNALPTVTLGGSRRERILRMAKFGDVAAETVSRIASDVLSSPEGQHKIVSAIINQEEYMRALYPLAKEEQGYDKVLQQIEAEKNQVIQELNKQIEQKRKEVEAAAHDLKIVRSKSKKLVKKNKKDKNLSSSAEMEALPADDFVNAAEIGRVSADLNGMQAQRRQLETELEDLQNRVQECRQRLADAQACESKQYGERRQQHREWLEAAEREQNGILNGFQQKLKDAYASLAFDGPLSQAIMQSASDYAAQKRYADIRADVLTLEEVKQSGGLSHYSNIQDLAEFVTHELNDKAYRNLSYNDVANLLLCISQNFLTILSGAPGTGKSSLIALLAHVLGLDNSVNRRYQEITVERGWVSRRDFIGYVNPISHTVEESGSGMYACLAAMKAETEKNTADFPYLVLLDDANVSSMEHYWADFMNLCDLKKRPRQISLGSGCVFPVSRTLRFAATVNSDNTTESLSQRLLDRAWLIKVRSHFREESAIREYELEDTYPQVPFSLFDNLNDPQKWFSLDLDGFVSDRLNYICETCYDYGFNISARTLGMLRRYCLAAKGVIDTSLNGFAALDYAVAQKVLPMLNGFGSEHRDFLQELNKLCDYHSMPLCNDLIVQSLDEGRGGMQYYRFMGR